ncbi:T9SS type A sorting domain-containing protein [Candidatus Dependentiae bacterium]|nr:T9SS type A sorting domain-containing protein [Candidatus Dependentiae bacterium]
MIGLNKIPASTNISSAFSNLIPEYIYHWNPESEDHEFHQKYQSVKNVNPGEGYFVIFPEQTVLSINGQYISDTYTINLKKGWNQIANPYYFVSDWNSARIITSSGAVLTATQAESEGYIYNKIFWYKDSDYYWGPNELIPMPQLYVWTGFWIEALKECSLQIAPIFSYAENNIVNLAPKRTEASENWAICVSANGNFSSDKINYFGVNESAQNQFDIFDVKKAPALSELMNVSFSENLKLCRDIRLAPIETLIEWQLNLNSGQNTQTSLEFNGLQSVPSKYVVYLVDKSDNKVYNLRETPSIPVTSANTVKKYRILAGYPEYVNAALAPSLSKNLTFVHPNPGPDENGLIRFNYNLSNAGTGNLTLKVFDLAGVKVLERQLNTSQTFYNWDCKNEKGKLVHTGVYIYILEYNGSGENIRLTDKFGITR